MKHVARLVLLISLSFSTTSLTSTASAANDKTALYAELLQQFVKDGQVDYTGFKKKETQLDTYLEYLAATDPASMEDKDRFAFYINAYNDTH